MRKSQFAAGLAACLLAISGCGDSTAAAVMRPPIAIGSAVDINGDGAKDGIAIDTNGDMVADAIDTNGDNISDGGLDGAIVVPATTTTGGEMTGTTTGGVQTTGGENTTGGEQTGGLNTTGGDDGGTSVPGTTGGGDCDDPGTIGNDCPGAVSCTDAVASCSVATQNCCVKDYAKDAVSCNDGATCDGLASAVCDGPEDCSAGQACCISVSVGLGGSQIDHRCVADATQCTGGLITNAILCHSDDDCGDGKGCGEIGNFPWWGICK